MTASIRGMPYAAARTTDCGVAADTDPRRHHPGLGGREDRLVLQRRAHGALPGHRLLGLERGEEVELLGEQPVVVGELVAEQPERLDERAAAELDLGTAVRERGERREALVDPDRVVGGEHRDTGAEPDPLGLPGDRGEHDVGREIA